MRATTLQCRNCRRDITEHCDTCKACWHPGVHPRSGERLVGCPIHDNLHMTVRWRYTTWQVAA